MQFSFEYKDKIIEFTVERRKRKTMQISIEPRGNIKVVAPMNASKKFIIEGVKSKTSWIVRKLSEYENMGYKDPHKEFVSGELFMYLGVEYPLHIVIDNNIKKPQVKLKEERLCITTNTAEKSVLKKTVERWYREQMVDHVQQKINHYQQHFQMQPSSIIVKEQKRRWATCTSQRKILFNWRGIMAPSDVLDYIVVHEMCHMVHMNHSKDFWDAVATILPDYKDKKDWLKNNGWRMEI